MTTELDDDPDGSTRKAVDASNDTIARLSMLELESRAVEWPGGGSGCFGPGSRVAALMLELGLHTAVKTLVNTAFEDGDCRHTLNHNSIS